MDLQPLLAALADGEIHSGEELATKLHVTRAAIWKKIQQLMAMGVVVEKIHAKGYRLTSPVDLLDHKVITAALASQTSFASLDIPFSTPSTNALAFQLLQENQALRSAHVVLSEHQTAGRGRRGKIWQSPVAGNIYLSIGWRYAAGIHVLSGMSVAIGVVVAELLNRLFDTDAFKLKWPNDIWWHDHKVGGILIEVQGDAASECACVIGLGLNVAPKTQWETPVTGILWQTLADIASTEQRELPTRNELAIELTKAIIQVCERFDATGVAAYLDSFRKLDALYQREVVVDGAQGVQLGIAQGIDSSGLLQVEIDGVLQNMHAAEVSLRLI